jgi:hypothetical protein
MEEYYITRVGFPIRYHKFTFEYISSLIDPIQYFFTRFDVLRYADYFKERGFDIPMIKRLQEDNIRSLPMNTYEQDDIIHLGQLLRAFYIEP